MPCRDRKSAIDPAAIDRMAVAVDRQIDAICQRQHIQPGRLPSLAFCNIPRHRDGIIAGRDRGIELLDRRIQLGLRRDRERIAQDKFPELCS